MYYRQDLSPKLVNDVHYMIYINTHTIHRYTGISCQDIHLGIFVTWYVQAATFVFSNAPFGFPSSHWFFGLKRDHMDQTDVDVSLGLLFLWYLFSFDRTWYLFNLIYFNNSGYWNVLRYCRLQLWGIITSKPIGSMVKLPTYTIYFTMKK